MGMANRNEQGETLEDTIRQKQKEWNDQEKQDSEKDTENDTASED
jgi:hypothetical protein